jgi:predicted RNase H-like HicB family nuclease
MRFRVVLEPCIEGGYNAYVPALPGCISDGVTEHEALHNAATAIRSYLEMAQDEWILLEEEMIREIEV